MTGSVICPNCGSGEHEAFSNNCRRFSGKLASEGGGMKYRCLKCGWKFKSKNPIRSPAVILSKRGLSGDPS